jgi:hypothetical protein
MRAFLPISGLPAPLFRAALGIVVVLTLLQTSLPATAADYELDSRSGQATVSAPLAIDLHMERVWTFFETTLNNRRRMVPFGVVGVCIALYVMFRARG